MFDLIWWVLGFAGLIAVFLIVRRARGYDDSAKIDEKIDQVKAPGFWSGLWAKIKGLFA